MATTGNTALFSGSSRYSSDFQALITRAVAIASLPLAQLNSQRTQLQSESTALGALSGKFSGIQAILSNLEAAAGLDSYAAAVSQSTVLRASVSDGVAEGAYSVEVTSLGAQTSTMSKNGLVAVTDPASQNISAASSFTLTIGGTPHTIAPGSNTLNSLVSAINGAGLEVQASVVNVGSSSAPDYRLAIHSANYDAVTVQLTGNSVALMDTLITGSKAHYKVNGLATEIQSTSRAVTLAPGLTIDLLAQSATGVATTITVTRGTAAVANALTALAAAYNGAVDELDKHTGQAGGALAGQSVIRTMQQALREMTQYSSDSGAITSFTDLGLEFDKEGKLSLNSATFEQKTGGHTDELFQFLGGSLTGGFLKTAGDLMDSLSDPASGFLSAASTSLTNEITAQDHRIAEEQDRIDLLEKTLKEQLAASDALIAALEQQANYLNSLFQSMRIASETYSR